MTNHKLSSQEYEAFRQFLEKASGIVLGENKHYLVTSRLGKVMREFNVASFRDLLTEIQSPRNSKLREIVINAMTTNETLWFRDGYPFEMLKKTIFPELSQKRPSQLKIWSAASSSGQEAYSISMTIQEYLASNAGSLPTNIQIIGTDISSSILAEAKAGVYDKLALIRGISEERKKRFFTPKGEQWEIRPEIKKGITFRDLNLANNYAGLGQFDMVFCRNVLIYFSTELKKDILNRIAKTMNKGGYLFLGGSESPTSYTDAFEMVRTPQGVVYRVKDEFASAGSIFNR
ncbi:MAG: protein-glutamate O-methyltransferase CheR [Chromatiales bacterium]|nr:protein-glutamate O-methyltransferase CheR [Chromatiales bacterium]